MRSIGKRNIKKLKILVRAFVPARAYDRARRDFNQWATVTAIENAVPEDWRNIWECADQEITRVICDEVNAILYRSADTDAPEQNKQYRLIGGTGEKSIANGNTWKDSEVK